MDAFWLAYGVDWLNLIVRWLHVITGIAWIGASFYFVWLDNTIRPPMPGSDLDKKGVSGELWAIHGGGFYNPQKYLVAPKTLPQELHWFKWEAYATWLSGFALLLIVYYFNASAMMIDKSVADISAWQSIAIGLASLLAGWAVYDGLSRSALGRRDGLFGIVIFLLLTAAAWGLSMWLSGRAVYIHVGAMIGTIMVANVLMVIIPGQKKMVAAMRNGQSPDPIHGQRGKQRSVHNNYFTLPVLFIMISNHYAMTYNHDFGWLVLAAIMAAGVLIRHFFNLKHKGKIVWAYPLAGVAMLFVVAVAIAPQPPAARPVATSGVDVAKVQAVIGQRCVSCHSAQPTQAGFAAAPAGIMLHTPELIRQNAAKIYRQTVQLKAMPIANLTQMTDDERALVGAWFEAGAK
ncbi:MAG: urate hydroxylase PuuD [Pseudomonadota bacterium]